MYIYSNNKCMCVFLISPVPITEPLTSELIDTPVFYNLAPRPIKYRVSVPIPSHSTPKQNAKYLLDHKKHTTSLYRTIIYSRCLISIITVFYGILQWHIISSITFEKRVTPLQNKMLNIYWTIKDILQVFIVLLFTLDV